MNRRPLIDPCCFTQHNTFLCVLQIKLRFACCTFSNFVRIPNSAQKSLKFTLNEHECHLLKLEIASRQNDLRIRSHEVWELQLVSGLLHCRYLFCGSSALWFPWQCPSSLLLQCNFENICISHLLFLTLAAATHQIWSPPSNNSIIIHSSMSAPTYQCGEADT